MPVSVPTTSAVWSIYGGLTEVAMSPVDLTDGNWARGVANGSTGFIIPPSQPNLATFTAGRRLQFSNGEQRQVVRTEFGLTYLTVILDGPVLDPAIAGAPNSFVVLPI
jgi:hypothetical protein